MDSDIRAAFWMVIGMGILLSIIGAGIMAGYSTYSCAQDVECAQGR